MQLAEQMITQYFPSFRSWRWVPPEMPDFASPKDLASLLVSYRAKLAEIRGEGGKPTEGLGDLPDSSLPKLLTLAYQASFLREEGRTVRGCLYAPPSWAVEEREASEAEGAMIQFAKALVQNARRAQEAATNRYALVTPLKLDEAKHIARFAPTLAAEDAVMLVHERGGELVCGGITLLDRDDAENGLLRMPRRWQGVGGLFVHILGPGELRVCEGRCEFTLQANQVRVYRDAAFADPVRSWLEEMAQSFVAECSGDPDWEADHIGSADVGFIDLMVLWSRVLREAMRMGHGGAFVVVPDVAVAPVQPKYSFEVFDLGKELRETWLALCRVWRALKANSRDQIVDLLEHKRQRTHKLCSASRSIGHLSATDGCVVLDRSLKVHGFGGEIQMKEGGSREGGEGPSPLATSKRCVRVIGTTREEVLEADLLRPFGQRHKSAYNLCKWTTNGLAFVISQDGDLRVFSSDDSTVYLHDLLHP